MDINITMRLTKEEEFLSDFFRYSSLYESEKEIPDGSWAWDFVKWFIDKIIEIETK